MKVKEVDRTANIAWSPAGQVPAYLAAGTAAQQLDATFSTNSELEIYSLNLSESGHDMPVVASLPVEQRFHKVVWGACGMADGTMPSGLIVGGSDNGKINMYDAKKLITGEDKPLVFTKDKHTGPVTALDFNPFQDNLLASGGSASELYIWDVNKLGAPMTPGAKSQPVDDVRCVSWNRQVQHILASTFSSRCVVWDLRKNDPIIKVSDSTSRMRCKVVAWHPDVATQLVLASEDDHTPVIQVWDLRLASSPLKTLEGHQRGILSLAWCQADSDLLLSCGKDNRILVWNPNSPQGEIVAELPTTNQWSFDVSWCPRNPAVIASASFDGHISLYSLMGGQQQVQPTNRITDSFGPDMGAIHRPDVSPQVTMQLKTPPKWLRRPCGATFGFGGKLITYENVAQTVTNPAGTTSTVHKPEVYIGQVVTEPELVESSTKLETSLSQGNYNEFCEAKLGKIGEGDSDSQLWKFIQARFASDPCSQYLNLLGINQAEISARLNKLIHPANLKKKDSTEELVDEFDLLKADGAGDAFDAIAATATAEQVEQAQTPLDMPFALVRDEETRSGQLTLALIAGDIELAVDICIEQNRMADALILAIRGGQEMLHKTQARYFQREASSEATSTAGLIQAVAMDDWARLVVVAGLDSWREVLAAVVTYCQPQTMSQLATQLGDRLSGAGESYRAESTLCYVVAGDLDKMVSSWMEGRGEDNSPGRLQELVEVVMLVRVAVQGGGGSPAHAAGGRLSSSLSQYASLLAAQGSLDIALAYLGDVSNDPGLQDLKERLEKCLAGPATIGGRQVAATTNRNVPEQRKMSLVDQRKMSVDSRRVSQDHTKHGQFNTGIPGGYNNQSQSNGYNNPGQSYGYNQPPAPAPTPAYAGFTPAPVEPSPPMQPPPASDQHTSHSNILKRGGRVVDGSIAAGSGGWGGGGGFTPQPAYTSNSYQGYAPPPEQPHSNTPNIFTPDAPAAHAPMAAPPQSYVPDHGGPGHTPVVSSGSGWNDPPPMMAKTPAPAQTTDTQAVTEPIVNPYMQPAAPEPAHAPPAWGGFQPSFQPSQQPGGFPPQQPGGFPPQQPSFQPQQPSFQPQQPGFQPQFPQQPGFQHQQPASQPGFQGFSHEEPEPVPEPEPTPPAPIPAEHQVIQDVLDNLKTKCQQAASHPQTRRKLDDVSMKLEILYNKLRSSALSPATLQGLHTILQHITQYDYPGCLQVISGLVSGVAFSELADFMPGVKVLLQVAQQQGVYLQQ